MIRVGQFSLSRQAALWLVLLAATFVLASVSKDLAAALNAKWMLDLPRGMQFIIKDDISDAMNWLVEDAGFGLFTFTQLTRGIAWVVEQPYDFMRALLTEGFLRGQGDEAVEILPSLSWVAVVFIAAAMGHYARSWKLAVFVGLCFLYLAVFGQWQSAMITLASIMIAVPFGIVGGLLLGIAGYRWPVFNRILTPVLDLMQTVPVFAYLVPILFLFGFGPVAALVATVIYAMPPMVRVTTLALQSVPDEIKEFGRMVGCTRRQMTWRVLVPSSLSSLMVGVNQVIMLSLNMVIIASMIGAGGLGYDVLTSLRRLDIGGGLESGAAIVVLAIALDRLSQAFAKRSPAASGAPSKSGLKRHPWLLTCLAVVLGAALVGLLLPAMQTYPKPAQLTTGLFWEEAVKWININFFDQLEAVKSVLLINFMIPVKRFLVGLPWPWVLFLVTLAGWQLGRARLALLCFFLAVFILLNGLWEKAMITVYLCGVSVIIASLIGIPLGVFSAQNERANRIVQGVIDTLQTLPSFVYLIPVVMLFRVGDFSAMIAVVLYALAPAVRYAAHGVRSIDPQLIEAGIVSGCTKRQLLTRIKLPLALPEIMLGINQTIMLALSMLVITALVGTRDLGQEVYIALTKADTGRGIVAGLSVAFIAIIADRLIAAGTIRAKRRLGLIG
ncbi:MAG: ABC transporter permease subunit [Alphaproteobacteria bacterium]